jgi:hypothetical protein
MKRRTRHTLILLGVPLLLILALGGWIVDALQTPRTLHGAVACRHRRHSNPVRRPARY